MENHEVGLTDSEALKRQKQYGLNTVKDHRLRIVTVLISQFTGNPLLLVLIAATTIAFFLGQHSTSYYIFAIILVSIALGFWNEYSAGKTVEALLQKISLTAIVLRDSIKKEIPVSQVTIGDIVFLSPGSIIPADTKLLEAKGLLINESALTGESMPAEKKQNDTIRMGTVVVNGIGRAVVIAIGEETEFGKVAKTVSYTKPDTEFQKGLAQFGKLLVKIILLLTVVLFVINALLGHKILESLLFSLAIAVGLTPELLPVIVTVSLAHGAGKLAKKHVVTKQLVAIENLGNMDVLCSDKTGTLTEGKIELIDYINAQGTKDLSVLHFALLANTAIMHHKMIGDPIDNSIWDYALKNNISIDHSIKKIDEEPFDYERRFMFTVASWNNTLKLIAKGAPDQILSLCKGSTHVFHNEVEKLAKQGYRIVALAAKSVENKKEYEWDDAKDLDFLGYVTFLDTPKQNVKEALDRLVKLNVQVKIITGDNDLVTKTIAEKVGLVVGEILVGPEIEKLSNQELLEKLKTIQIFAKVTPSQKERIVTLLRKQGHVVGYVGDGINDVAALHEADVGISVNTAVDVAKNTASIVLLSKSLDVVVNGIMEGRRIFSNTIKYILMSTSSNFGNMFSASGASFFLPFLPMTPVQVLLVNSLYDVSQTTIPSDNVDAESLIKPRHFNIAFIKKYMLFFGPISSLYDFLTFGVMLYFFHARNSLFQTGWFVESLLTEILVVFVIRTSRTPFFKSKPGKWLTITCCLMLIIGLVLPYSAFSNSLGFTPLPALYFFFLIILVGTYLVLVEILKSLFLKRYSL